MFYASDCKVHDIVFVVTTIVLPDGSSVARGTRAEVICVHDNSVDLQIVSTEKVATDCRSSSLPVNTTFSLYDALGHSDVRSQRDAKLSQSVMHIEIVFRKNQHGADYKIDGPVYPIAPTDQFKTVSSPPHGWESADGAIEALVAYGRRLRDKDNPPQKPE